jgi:hypothetical protein
MLTQGESFRRPLSGEGDGRKVLVNSHPRGRRKNFPRNRVVNLVANSLPPCAAST